MQVAVIGTGYVGLVAGTCFAHGGQRVTCVDIDQAKVQTLRDGQIPIYEPGLATLVKENVRSGRLQFTTDAASAVDKADVVFIAVGTPPGEDGSADLTHVLGVAHGIAPHLNDYTVVVCKSTVPVGTCDKVEQAIEQSAPDADFDVVSNPEFLKEGAAIDDFLHPDRVVVGTDSERARRTMRELYKPFINRREQILFMTRRAAEMTKYAANCMLAARISFMNEIARVCDAFDVDVLDVKRGIGSDARIGPHFLNAGIGYGGSCFPKDVQALYQTGTKAGCDMELLGAVERVNARQKTLLAERVVAHFDADALKGLRVALLGLAFKPETDDMREAPSVDITRELRAQGVQLAAYDPVATETAQDVLGPGVTYHDSWQSAVANVDAILLVTEWLEFRGISPADLAAATACRLVFDGRNVWAPEAMKAEGFAYFGVGRRGG
ncbi:MAG TPA: UDP-glucose 6-dehydrogenase [Myxococcales bacterium]|nr:UDP-glucose 6-dehydrogenase [Myxococcales bacterium]HAN30662.1 UDP-glucose 6-dehydrogenase [Myxococcales bacterium]